MLISHDSNYAFNLLLETVPEPQAMYKSHFAQDWQPTAENVSWQIFS